MNVCVCDCAVIVRVIEESDEEREKVQKRKKKKKTSLYIKMPPLHLKLLGIKIGCSFSICIYIHFP